MEYNIPHLLKYNPQHRIYMLGSWFIPQTKNIEGHMQVLATTT